MSDPENAETAAETPPPNAPPPRGKLEALHEFWSSRRWFVKLLCILVILSPLAFYAAVPAWQSFTEWRLDRNMTLAKEAMDAGDYPKARNLAYSVLLKRDDDIAVIRLAAHAMNRVGDPKRSDIARYLLLHPEATTDDRLWAWKVIVCSFPLAVVTYDWQQSLNEPEQKRPEFFLPLADRLIVEKHFDDAMELFDPVDIGSGSSTPSEIERRLLEILVACGKATGISEAQSRFLKRIDAERGDIGELLPQLDPIPSKKLDPELGHALFKWVLDQKNPTPSAALSAARFQLAVITKKEVGDIFVQTIVERWRSAAPVELGRWLLNIGRAELALDILPPEETPSTADFYRLRRDALAALGRWDELLQMLAAFKTPPSGIPKLEWHCDTAIAAMHTGYTSFQNEQWLAATTEARITSADGGYIDLARMARAGGLLAESRETMLEAVRTARGPLPLYSSLGPLLDWLYDEGRAEDMLNVATIYLPIEPGNPNILIHYCYLKTMLGQIDPPLTRKLLEPLLKEHPDNPSIHRIFAFQDLLCGESAKAAETLRPLVDESEETISNRVNRVLYGIALLDSGDPKGLDITASVDWSPLMPNESMLFDQMITAALEKLDPESKAQIAAKANALAEARKKAIEEARLRAKAMMAAREKVRPEAEKHARALMEAKEKALPAAAEKARALMESEKKIPEEPSPR
jgi:hypothetical protein